MKPLKSISMVGLSALFLLGTAACKDKCDGENPEARLVNNGTTSIDVQIKTSGGNTENINNIAKGTESAYRSFAPGQVVFTITPKGLPLVVDTVYMDHCYTYDITLNSENKVVTTATDRNK